MVKNDNIIVYLYIVNLFLGDILIFVCFYFLFVKDILVGYIWKVL